jgi:hypothetical protein
MEVGSCEAPNLSGYGDQQSTGPQQFATDNLQDLVGNGRAGHTPANDVTMTDISRWWALTARQQSSASRAYSRASSSLHPAGLVDRERFKARSINAPPVAQFSVSVNTQMRRDADVRKAMA